MRTMNGNAMGHLGKQITAAAVALILLLCAAAPSQGAYLPRPYSHYSDSEGVASVLSDFARAEGYDPQVSSKLTGVMSGRFSNMPPQQFLDGMRAAFGVRAYTRKNTMFFFHESEWGERMIKPVNVDGARLLSGLERSGAIPPELPARLNGSVVVLQGPPALLDSLTQICDTIDQGTADRMVMRVFKLRHAKADDTELSSMDKTIVVPGVASILKRMTEGTGGTGPTVTRSSSTVKKLLGTGLAASADGASGGDQGGAIQQTSAVSATGQGGIMADTRLNAVVINDYEYRMPYYEKVIADLDQPVKLVELHAAIVDVDIDATRDLGISWQGGIRRGNWSVAGGVGKSSSLGWDGGSNPVSNSDSGGIFSTVFSTERSSFLSNLHILEENSKARTLGRPSVLTLDNTEATIEDTVTRYIQVPGYQAVDLFKVDSGTVLQVTPHIIDDSAGGPPYISMVVSIQSNQDSGSTVTATSADSVPPIKQTRINTRALVREGQSLLLGGYYVEYRKDSSSGVPGAKDVPVVGGLFGEDGRDSYRRERLILITPKVMDLGELQAMPHDLDEKTFHVSPTQDSYLKRAPAKGRGSGCSSTNAGGGSSTF